MYKKILTVVITILFLGTCITPSDAIDTIEQSSIPISDKTIITVDDEGDGDYTSIKDALSHAYPGVTIEVYSGTYYENNIYIGLPGLTLKGVPQELGSGNDTGKPVITSELNSYNYILNMGGDNVTITGFVIIDSTAPNVMTFPIRIMGGSCTFANNNVNGGMFTLSIGEDLNHPNHYSLNTRVIGNTFYKNSIGISYSGKYGYILRNNFSSCKQQAIEVYGQSTSNDISYNSLRNCSTGILYYNGSKSIISHNFISADTGIELVVTDAENISIMMNQVQQCGKGIYLRYSHSLIKVHQNNFINNLLDIRFVRSLELKYNYLSHPIFNENYYNSWIKFGPKWIRGFMILFWIPILIPEIWFGIPIFIPWFYPDLNPSKEPYDI